MLKHQNGYLSQNILLILLKILKAQEHGSIGAEIFLEIQLGYAIGVSEPVSVSVDTFGTGRLPDDILCDWVRNSFDLRPGAIIHYLNLDRPIFAETTNYGHFGRNVFSWEQINEAAKSALEAQLSKNRSTI